MNNKILALAGCIAVTAPTTSIADVLPENLVGLNLGEISSSSFLNQPFKGVIPFLFTSYENSKNLDVRLAPEYIFNEIGAERHPILNSLNFQITKQNNKPVILISSDQPIQLPFLNFVLEIQGPEGSVYQDYTVLLDPASKQVTTPEADYIVVNEFEINETIESKSIDKEIQETKIDSEESLKADGALLLASLSSRSLPPRNQSLKYRVKTGDSLSKIAQNQNARNVSIKTMSQLILQKNPTAFIRGDANRIKKGALLILPSTSEINGFELAGKNSDTTAKSEKVEVATKANTEINKESLHGEAKTTYTVVKGDNLSKITKKFATKDISFTKMMNAIYSNNPEAFVSKSKNKIMAGAELIIPAIPAIANVKLSSSSKNIAEYQKPDIESKADSPAMVNKMAESLPVEEKITKSVDLEVDQYRVEKGDTLSLITKNIGYKEVPFAQMLKAIYVHNPNAFVDGTMTKLAVGSVITLPLLSDFKISSAQSNSTAGLKQTVVVKKAGASIPVVSINKSGPPSDLVRRIRELRKELKQTKDSLSEMKSSLKEKETLLQQKNDQIDSLKITLAKLNESIDPELMTAAAVVVKQAMAVSEPIAAAKSVLAESKPVQKDTYRPKSKAEIAKLKRDLLINQEKTNKQLAKIDELKSKTLSANKSLSSNTNQGLFKKYAESDIVSFAKTNYSYLTIALLLTLFLVRYRRELYAYTYSTINYDHPTYYPVPDADKYQLKERNISYHDPRMDEDSSNYEFLSANPEPEQEKVSAKVVINPILVEATQEIFATTDDEKQATINDEKQATTDDEKQIEHCEHLVTELFDDLITDENSEDYAEWQNIEEVCDTYIEKIKDTDSVIAVKENGALVDEVTDFNHMMSDLLESLDKVDQSVKRNNISDDAFPDLVSSSTEAEFAKDRDQG